MLPETTPAIAANTKTIFDPPVAPLTLANGAAVPPAAPGPQVKDIGFGSLTVIPKNTIANAPVVKDNPVGENAAGLYERTGVPPPIVQGAPILDGQVKLANGTIVDAKTGALISGPTITAPSYPGSTSSVDRATVLKSYTDTLDAITSLEGKIAGSAAPSEEEKTLAQSLAAAKAKLNEFDLSSLQQSEDLRGQGRGATLGNINISDSILSRTRALQRLGLAQEADTINNQLALAKEDRVAQGDVAQAQYNLATKKLDIALGIQDKIEKINADERDNARQFLLDVTDFAAGKSYDKLDQSTQSQILTSVANSPITLDMVKTALASAAEKQAATEAGNLRTVAGLGVVQIKPDNKGGYTYKVVVPENPTTPVGNAPTFEDYVSSQNIPYPALTPEKLNALHQEYDSKYANQTQSLGKVTPTQKSSITQAGLIQSAPAIQSYFINTPSSFQDDYTRRVVSGQVQSAKNLNELVDDYTKWYNEQNSGTRDWSKLLGG